MSSQRTFGLDPNMGMTFEYIEDQDAVHIDNNMLAWACKREALIKNLRRARLRFEDDGADTGMGYSYIQLNTGDHSIRLFFHCELAEIESCLQWVQSFGASSAASAECKVLTFPNRRET